MEFFGGTIFLKSAMLGVAWDPLGWLHDWGWYQDLLRADWFAPLRPYWIRFRLDWVVAGLILLFSLWLVRKAWRAMRRRMVSGLL